MSRPEHFYGEDDGRPFACEVLANLYEITGSMECAEDLVLACDEVEKTLAGRNIALIPMPAWVC